MTTPIIRPELTPGEIWKVEASRHLWAVCAANRQVTVDDVWPLITFPTAPHDGRLLGRVVACGLKLGWLEKDKDGNIWRALDHTDLPPVVSRDGRGIVQRALLPVYRSLVFGSDPEAWPRDEVLNQFRPKPRRAGGEPHRTRNRPRAGEPPR